MGDLGQVTPSVFSLPIWSSEPVELWGSGKGKRGQSHNPSLTSGETQATTWGPLLSECRRQEGEGEIAEVAPHRNLPAL